MSGVQAALATSAAGRGGAAAMSLGAVVISARLLGPDDYGKLSLVLATSSVVYALAASWTVTPTYVLAASEHGRTGSFRQTAWARASITLASTSISLTLVAIGAWLVTDGRVTPTLAIAWVAAAVGYVVWEHVITLLEVKASYAGAALLQVVRPFAYLSFLLTIWAYGRAHLAEILWSLTASWVVAVGLSIVVATRLTLWPPSAPRQVRRELWSLAAPLTVHAVCQLLFGVVDIYMVEAFLTTQDVGHYGLAYQAFSMGLLLVSAALPVLIPRLSRGGTDEDIHHYAMTISKRILPAAGVALAAVTPFVPAVVALAFGQDYRESSDVLVVLMPALGMLASATILSPTLSVSRRTRWISAIAATGLATNVVMDVVLIVGTDLGILAPAVATTLAAAIVLLLHAMGVRRLVKVPVDSFIAWVVPVLVSATATLFLPLGLALIVVASACVTVWAFSKRWRGVRSVRRR